MRKLMTIMAVLFCLVASAQYTPTGSKTRWINGVGLSSTRDTSLFTSAADTNIVTTWNGNIYWKGTGYWNKIGHSTNVGAQIHDSLYAVYQLKAGTSAGARLVSNSGTVISEWGLGGSANMDFHGFAGYDANRSASYTARSFTDKNFVDSSRALDVQLAGTQTITGAKTFSNVTTYDSTAKFLKRAIISPTGLSYAQVTGTLEDGPALFINRDISNASSVNEHGIIDRTNFSRSGKAYNSYDAQAQIIGSNNLDHYTGFQNRGLVNIPTKTLTNYWSFTSIPQLTSGTITTLAHFEAYTPVSTGTITNEYGIYIQPLLGTRKYAFYSQSDSVFVGNQIEGLSFKKTGGTSSQFLKANGSVDGTSYFPVSGGSFSGSVSVPNGSFYQGKRADGVDINLLGFISGTNNTRMTIVDEFKMQTTGLSDIFTVNSSGTTYISSLGTGTVQATAGVLSIISDGRLKNKLGYYSNALDAISKLGKPQYWKYSAKSGLPKSAQKVKQFGLLADDVHKVLGEEFAPTQKNGYYGLSDRALLGLAIQAIQELKAEIELLKKK